MCYQAKHDIAKIYVQMTGTYWHKQLTQINLFSILTICVRRTENFIDFISVQESLQFDLEGGEKAFIVL